MNNLRTLGLIVAVALSACFSTAAQAVCTGQFAGGEVCGNTGTTLNVPSPTANPVLGVPGTTPGSISFSGATSGQPKIVPQAAAGNATLTLPTTNGTIPSTAAAPVTLNTTTGEVGCSTCLTTTGSFANPTAKVGLSAVNGTAPTAMRSDASPPLDQTISPTWTGTHTFTNSLLRLLGSSTGYTTFTSANGGASNFTLTFPAVTDTLAALGTAQTWTALQKYTNGDLGLLGSSTGYTLLESGLSGAGNNTLTLPTTSSDTLAALGTAQTWSALQQFNDGDFALKGSASGTLVQHAASAAGSSVLTWPVGTTNFSSTGPGILQQANSGSAFTVGVAPLSMGGFGADQSAATAGQIPVLTAGVYFPTTVVVYASGFGANCNNSSATDNLAALNSAIAYAITLGRATVQIPGGTCYISGSLTVGSSTGLTLQGTGGNSTSIIKLMPTSASSSIFGTTSSDFTVRDIVFDANNVAGSNPTIQVSNSINVTLDNVRSINFLYASAAFDGVQIGRMNNYQCSRAATSETATECFIIASSSTASKDIIFQNPHFVNAGTQFDGSNIQVNGGECDHWGYGTCVGFGTTANSFDNSVIGMYMHDGAGIDSNGALGSGIEIGSPGTVFTNNRIVRVAGAGIDLFGKNSIIKNNYIEDCGKITAYLGTSTTANNIGAGSKTWTTQTGLSYVAGQSVILYQTSANGNLDEGTVTSYNSVTGVLVVNVTVTGGSGIGITDWSIAPNAYAPVGIQAANFGGGFTADGSIIEGNVVVDTGGGTCHYGYGEYHFGTVTNVIVNWNDFGSASLDWYAPSTSLWGPAATTRLMGLTPAASSVNSGPLAVVNGKVTPIGQGTDNQLIIGQTAGLPIWTSTVPPSAEPAFTGGDVTSAGGNLILNLVNIPTATPLAGSLLSTEIAAPGTPASGKVSIWSDSTDARLHDKNPAGTIGTTVVADAGASNDFLTGISTAGVISKARPTCGNLSDSTSSCSTANTSANTASTIVSRDGSGNIAISQLTASSITGLSTPLSTAQGGTGNAGGSGTNYSWAAYTPTWNFTGGTTVATASNSGSFSQTGKTLCFNAFTQVTWVVPPTAMTLTLPNSATAASYSALHVVNLSSQALVTGYSTTGTTPVTLYANGSTSLPLGTSGQFLMVSGCLQVQ